MSFYDLFYNFYKMPEGISKAILEKTGFILVKHNLHIVEQSTDYLKLSNSYCIVVAVYNKLENSYALWLGKNDKNTNTVEIDNDLLTRFFHSQLRLSQVTKEAFLNNLVLFFENEAQSLLKGDIDLINQLEKFDLERTEKYNEDLLQRQTVNAANTAWERHNYKEFVLIMEQVDRSKLPASFELKYKIARKRIMQ